MITFYTEVIKALNRDVELPHRIQIGPVLEDGLSMNILPATTQSEYYDGTQNRTANLRFQARGKSQEDNLLALYAIQSYLELNPHINTDLQQVKCFGFSTTSAVHASHLDKQDRYVHQLDVSADITIYNNKGE